MRRPTYGVSLETPATPRDKMTGCFIPCCKPGTRPEWDPRYLREGRKALLNIMSRLLTFLSCPGLPPSKCGYWGHERHTPRSQRQMEDNLGKLRWGPWWWDVTHVYLLFILRITFFPGFMAEADSLLTVSAGASHDRMRNAPAARAMLHTLHSETSVFNSKEPPPERYLFILVRDFGERGAGLVRDTSINPKLLYEILWSGVKGRKDTLEHSPNGGLK